MKIKNPYLFSEKWLEQTDFLVSKLTPISVVAWKKTVIDIKSKAKLTCEIVMKTLIINCNEKNNKTQKEFEGKLMKYFKWSSTHGRTVIVKYKVADTTKPSALTSTSNHLNS